MSEGGGIAFFALLWTGAGTGGSLRSELISFGFLPADGGARWEAETGVRSDGRTRSVC
jgi:hypothetical protein